MREFIIAVKLPESGDEDSQDWECGNCGEIVTEDDLLFDFSGQAHCPECSSTEMTMATDEP